MNTEELNALKERAYKTAAAHGFHKEERPDAYWLGLVMSEMGEAINADREGMYADTKRFEEVMAMGTRLNLLDVLFESYIKDSVEDEIADIFIRLLDFAGMKGYTLYFKAKACYSLNTTDALLKFEESGMPGMLFFLMDILTAAFGRDELQTGIYNLMYILYDCFEKMTGSNRDLLWFVKMKMRYNELWPKLNGKKY